MGTRRPRLGAALLRALVLALVGLASAANTAEASLTRVSMRIEGGAQTLFEGPMASEGHAIQAGSDTQSRQCDGLSNPENSGLAGATPTATAVDAMSLIGETFDGRWYPGYNDYLITRWGPVHEAEGMSWFLFVNHTFVGLGGCQIELHEGGEVVWDYALGPAGPKSMLELYPAGDTSAAPPLTAAAKLGTPFALEVQSAPVATGKPPALPERTGFTPSVAATVAPVSTGEKGFETLEAASPEALTTNAEGRTSITFTTPGWHRLKASHSAALVSNRLDVCAFVSSETECGTPPPEDQVRSTEHEEPITGHEPEPPAHKTETQAPTGETQTSGGHTGPGTSTGQSPAGEAPLLHVAGYSLEALDVRSRALHFHGHWRRIVSSGAWHGVAAVGSAGASVAALLRPGRPAFATLYSGRARIELRVGHWRRTIALTSRHTPSLLSGPKRTRGGEVELRVISGTLAVDGVAVIG
jgi:hypothetical protein